MDEDAFNAQDKILAQKLWNNIFVRGHDPQGLLQPPCAAAAPDPETPSVDVSCIFSPDPLLSTAPPLTPEDATPGVPNPDVLSMSQVVATLIFRHRSQTSNSRPRPMPSYLTSDCRTSKSQERKSPLSKMHIDGVKPF